MRNGVSTINCDFDSFERGTITKRKEAEYESKRGNIDGVPAWIIKNLKYLFVKIY